MAERRVGIVMNGVTGRTGMNRQPVRSIAANLHARHGVD
jgi:hypothetical protein